MESEWYGSESVTVTFEWTQERDILYNVTVYPLPVVDYYVGSTRIQITVLYNIQYQVSVSATICEHITTAIRRLHYGLLITTALKAVAHEIMFINIFHSQLH